MRFRLTILLTFLFSIFGQAQESPEYSLSLEGSAGVVSNQQKTLEPYSWYKETYEFEPQLIEARPLWNTTGISFSRRKNNWEFGFGVRSFNLKYFRDSIFNFEFKYGQEKAKISHVMPIINATRYFNTHKNNLFPFVNMSVGYYRMFTRYYPNATAYEVSEETNFEEYTEYYQNRHFGYNWDPSFKTFDIQLTGGVQYKIQRWSANIGLSYYYLRFEHYYEPDYFSFNHGLYISGKLGFRLNKIE